MKKYQKNTLIIICLSLVIIQCDSKDSSKPPIANPEGMVWIPSGEFFQGASENDRMALDHEFPAHKVKISGFFMDETEVTNAQFAKFIDATGYITVAERVINWDSLKLKLPPGTLKPADSLLQPSSLTFHKPVEAVYDLRNFTQWWRLTIGANWKHPHGPNSTIIGKENHPVVHIAYEDAVAYSDWKGHRLPTESEWEYAARAHSEFIFIWGKHLSDLPKQVNSWTGDFPNTNTIEDGYEYTAPVKSYSKNAFGLFEMSGNVWEWTSDNYEPNYLFKVNPSIDNNSLSKKGHNMMQHQSQNGALKVIKGGSFLCHSDYCASYRISARMSSDVYSSAEHIGFRTVLSPDMIQSKQR